MKAVFASIYGVIRALAMLVIYDRLLVLFCGLTLAPLVILSRRLARRSFSVNTALNDQLEREVEVIEDGRSGAVLDHYRAWPGVRSAYRIWGRGTSSRWSSSSWP